MTVPDVLNTPAVAVILGVTILIGYKGSDWSQSIFGALRSARVPVSSSPRYAPTSTPYRPPPDRGTTKTPHPIRWRASLSCPDRM